MIDLKLYEKDSDFQQRYLTSLKNRGEDASPLDKVIELNQSRKKMIFEIDQLIVERRTLEKSLRASDSNKKKEIVSKAQSIGNQISNLQNQLRDLELKIDHDLMHFPNICHSSVPVGSTSEDNQLVREVGSPRQFTFPILSHLEVAAQHIDTQRAAKVTGARFSFLRGEAAWLERALAQYMLDVHTKKNGYEELHTPYIVNASSLRHTGQLPKFKEDVFHLSNYEGYLIPTAEVSVTNFFANEILSDKDLPIRFVAYTPCFRSEAGAYGQDTKGLIRQHQFTKVELVMFSHPSSSYDELENLTSHAEGILKNLELPYRVMSLCTGDLGFGASKCYDLEVWLPSQNTFREISSCSNYEDYQARRAKIRFKSDKKVSFVHTLNGSGLAVGRTLIAILENYQNEDGSVTVPKVIQPYMDGKKVIFEK
ncbi:MAG: serine--tRNA ligase [Bdellovibrionales bacterium]|nr:serine--tRNA ligase [Bdellovibrionales bacterium]